MYRTITKVTAPILRPGSTSNAYRNVTLQQVTVGGGREDVIVVDQNRVLRYTLNGIQGDLFPQLNRIVDALLTKSPIIALSLREIYFGLRIEAGVSKTVEMVVDNTGDGPLDITGYTAPPGVVIEPASFTVGAQEKKTVQITFTPTQTGTFSGTVSLNHTNTAVGPLQVPILNIAVDPARAPSIGLAEPTLNLGQPEVGQTVQQTITITNGGPGTLNVSDIQSSLSGLTFSGKQFSIPAGGSREITITFRPQAEGAFSGTLTVLSNDPDKGSLQIALSGTAIFVPADPRADFDRNGTIDFADFLSFVRAFGTTDAAFDIDGNGRVDFNDFLIFAKSFGKPLN